MCQRFHESVIRVIIHAAAPQLLSKPLVSKSASAYRSERYCKASSLPPLRTGQRQTLGCSWRQNRQERERRVLSETEIDKRESQGVCVRKLRERQLREGEHARVRAFLASTSASKQARAHVASQACHHHVITATNLNTSAQALCQPLLPRRHRCRGRSLLRRPLLTLARGVGWRRRLLPDLSKGQVQTQ